MKRQLLDFFFHPDHSWWSHQGGMPSPAICRGVLSCDEACGVSLETYFWRPRGYNCVVSDMNSLTFDRHKEEGGEGGDTIVLDTHILGQVSARESLARKGKERVSCLLHCHLPPNDCIQTKVYRRYRRRCSLDWISQPLAWSCGDERLVLFIFFVFFSSRQLRIATPPTFTAPAFVAFTLHLSSILYNSMTAGAHKLRHTQKRGDGYRRRQQLLQFSLQHPTQRL